jgi:hypothetical protein
MQKIIGRLLKKGNTVTGTQTDPIEGLELSGKQEKENFQHQNAPEAEFNSNSGEERHPSRL